jgi:hypothetical protein
VWRRAAGGEWQIDSGTCVMSTSPSHKNVSMKNKGKRRRILENGEEYFKNFTAVQLMSPDRPPNHILVSNETVANVEI